MDYSLWLSELISNYLAFLGKQIVLNEIQEELSLQSLQLAHFGGCLLLRQRRLVSEQAERTSSWDWGTVQRTKSEQVLVQVEWAWSVLCSLEMISRSEDLVFLEKCRC